MCAFVCVGGCACVYVFRVSRYGADAKAHEKSETRCIALFKLPFNPRPTGSPFNYPVSPVGRFMRFVHVNGRECHGRFRAWLGDESFNFEIHYAFDGDRRPRTFKGDYRKLILKPILIWLN